MNPDALLEDELSPDGPDDLQKRATADAHPGAELAGSWRGYASQRASLLATCDRERSCSYHLGTLLELLHCMRRATAHISTATVSACKR